MQNIRQIKGTYKGNIGENLFASTRKKIILTQMHKPNFVDYYMKNLTKEQSNFLKENWSSIDAINLDKLTLYEVKTRNWFRNCKRKRPSCTLKSIKIYESAKNLGFDSKFIMVYLGFDWNFWTKELNFERGLFHIT